MNKNNNNNSAIILFIAITVVLIIVGFVTYVEDNNRVVAQNYNACSNYWLSGGLVDVENHPWPEDCTEVLDDLILPQWFN